MSLASVIGMRLQQTADDALARCQEIRSLAGKTDRQSAARLFSLLYDGRALVQWEATEALALTAHKLQGMRGLAPPSNSPKPFLTLEELFGWMREKLQSPLPQERAITAEALGFWHFEAVVPELTALLGDPSPLVRANAADALGRIGDQAPVPALIALLHDKSLWVQRAAAQALGAIGAPEAVEPLGQMLANSEIALVRASAISALGHIPLRKARRIVSRYAWDSSEQVRWCVARALGIIGDASSLITLKELSKDSHIVFGRSIGEVAQESIRALEKREGILRRALANGWAKAQDQLHKVDLAKLRRFIAPIRSKIGQWTSSWSRHLHEMIGSALRWSRQHWRIGWKWIRKQGETAIRKYRR